MRSPSHTERSVAVADREEVEGSLGCLHSGKTPRVEQRCWNAISRLSSGCLLDTDLRPGFGLHDVRHRGGGAAAGQRQRVRAGRCRHLRRRGGVPGLVLAFLATPSASAGSQEYTVALYPAGWLWGTLRAHLCGAKLWCRRCRHASPCRGAKGWPPRWRPASCGRTAPSPASARQDTVLLLRDAVPVLLSAASPNTLVV